MKQFILLYFLFLALLFTLFYLPTSSFSSLLNQGQTNLTLYFLDFFLDTNQREGTHIAINPHYKIIITQACNGMIPILFFFASILAYPSTFIHKFMWVILGYILFSIVNVIRLLFVIYITKHGEGYVDFYWSHDLVGNALLMSTGLLLFILFIKRSRSSKTS